jgi:UDPglucose 6-dehydrogenase
VLLHALIGAGAKVQAYDPVAMPTARRELPEGWFREGKLTFVEGQYEALKGVDAMVLVTEWKPFRHPDFARIKQLMREAVIFDGRNQYEPQQLRELGFEYRGIGR